MALRSALVDRARIVTREKVGARVEGTTNYAPVMGPWFQCRLAVEGPSAEQTNDGNVRTLQTPTLLYWNVADDDTPVVLNADDEVEIVSNQEGTAVWQITAKPLVIRRKRTLLGASYVNVKRVGEPPAPFEPPGVAVGGSAGGASGTAASVGTP